MVLQKNYKYILRSLLVSKYSMGNTHDINKIKSVHLQISPVGTSKEALFYLASFVTGLTGTSPSFLYNFNKRTKERFIGGAKVTFNKRSCWSFLTVLNNLVFFEAANFRGFQISPKSNRTLNLNLKHLSFYYGTHRAFDGELPGFNDSSLRASLQISFSTPLNNGFLLKGASIPVYY
jgi:hypothetical protein